MADDIELNSGAGTESPELAPAAAPSSPEAGAEAPKKISLRDELTKNFNELREPKELRSREPKAEKPVKAAAKSDDERPRDQTGKFLPKEDKPVEAQAAPAEKPTKEEV